ncbi:MAG: DUF2974 domain-containing protein [Clostridia bacterium]|nr:DUF2974 domain-containing protein [Clostridia bacterium]
MDGKLSKLDLMLIQKKREQLLKKDTEKERILETTQNATLLDYVQWVGDVGFDQLPFREADALVLCIVSYYELLQLFAEGQTRVRLSECAALIEAGRARLMITGGDMGNTDVFRAAALSRRFGELEITDYVDKLSTDPPLQFSAMCFHFRDKFSFIAYRGTDSSIAGWRENFMISFTRTTAQNLASEYASQLVEPGRVWYIAGHSKGGNLALIAASLLPAEQMDYVKRVFVLDGPGLCPEVFDEQMVHKIDDKITRIVPEFDVIGKLFEPKVTDTRIVKSYRTGIEQHSLASWMVSHGDLAQVNSFAPGSRWINDLMDEWIAGIPLEERAVFVDELFDAMEEAGIKDLSEVSPEYFGNLLIRIGSKSDTTKKVLKSLPRKLLLDDTETEPLKTKLPRIFSNSLLLTALVMVVLGVAVLFASNKILEIVSVALVAVIAAVEIFVIIRRLIKTKGKLDGLRERIFITIGLLALIPVVLIKEKAMFILGSVIFGVLFLVLGYVAGERAVKEKRIFVRILHIIECVLAITTGIFFLIVPSGWVRTLAIVLGIVLLTLAAARFGYLIWAAVKKKKESDL